MLLQVNNGFGSFLGVLQLILYFIYRKNKGKDKDKNENKNKNTAIVSMELGLPDEPNKDKELSNTNGTQDGHV